MNASTFTARVIASTGADVAAALSGAVGAMSGPLHGGAPSRVLGMIEEIERTGDAEAYVKQALDKGERLMGFGHRVYRAEDPRARVLRRTARELGAPRFEVAEALEKAALEELHARRPDRVLATNVEFWAAIVLDFAEVPAHMFTSMFTCARTAGWSAHILEQKRTGRLVRPSARTSARGRGTREDPNKTPAEPSRCCTTNRRSSPRPRCLMQTMGAAAVVLLDESLLVRPTSGQGLDAFESQHAAIPEVHYLQSAYSYLLQFSCSCCCRLFTVSLYPACCSSHQVCARACSTCAAGGRPSPSGLLSRPTQRVTVSSSPPPPGPCRPRCSPSGSSPST